MLTKNLSLLAVAFLLFACGNTKNIEEEKVVDAPQPEKETEVVKDKIPSGDTSIVWVNSSLGTLTSGEAGQMGLLTQEGTKYPSIENWECIYPRINGFIFEPGYVCQLKVITETVQGKPQLRMVELVSKMMDMDYYRLHDIWACTHLNGEVMDVSATRPSMEINLKIMKIMGKGMCNQYFGKITKYGGTSINFGSIAGTKMMCPEIEVEKSFLEALSETQSFEVKNLTLSFFNAEKKEVLRFQKVD